MQLMVVRPMFQETTALGAALAAGLGADVWTRELVFASASYNNIEFKPSITDTEADKRWVCGMRGGARVRGFVVAVGAVVQPPGRCPSCLLAAGSVVTAP